MENTKSLDLKYLGEAGRLIVIGLITGFLTVITLGFYRFWAKTRIRRYLWSSIRIGDDSLEYLGTGLEKFLGFLIALVIVAVYLAILNGSLLYLGFVALPFGDGGQFDLIAFQALTSISFIAMIPLYFYARFRARRYRLARTRWRGIRFAQSDGAWGYVWRAIGYSLLTLCSLGLLLPLMTFKLEKYVTDRTWYGRVKFVQHGEWTMLYPAMKHLFIAVAIGIVSFFLLPFSGTSNIDVLPSLVGIIGIFVAYIWFAVGVVYYRQNTHQLLSRHKSFGEKVRFISEPLTRTIIYHYIIGGLLASIVSFFIISVIVIVAVIIFTVFTSITEIDPFGSFSGIEDIEALEQTIGFLVSVVFVVFASLIYSATTLGFITQPILAHYVTQTSILNPDELDDILQRGEDKSVEAEGFADALDFGAAF